MIYPCWVAAVLVIFCFIFTHSYVFGFSVKAFHMKYDELPLDKNIANWNVQVMDINRSRRHNDRAVLLKFWNSLEK